MVDILNYLSIGYGVIFNILNTYLLNTVLLYTKLSPRCHHDCRPPR